MAYGVKYRIEWEDVFRGNSFKVDFEKEGYASTITSLGHTNDAFVLNHEDDGWVLGSEALISFSVTDSDRAAYDADFFDSAYKNIKVKFYIDSVLKWVGWLRPENTTREYDGPQVLYKVSASDGLRSLRDIDYAGYYKSGRQSGLQIIKNAISEIGIDDLDFAIQCNLYEDALMTATDQVFVELEIDNRRFYTEKDGELVPDSCYDVLEQVIKPYYCQMMQDDGYWRIINQQEHDSRDDWFDYSTLTELTGSGASKDRTVAIDAIHRPLENSLELSKEPALRKLRVTFKNKNLGDNLVLNPGFDSGTTGYTNSGWDQFTTLDDGSGSNTVLNTTHLSTDAAIKYVEVGAVSLSDVNPDADSLYVSFRLKLKSIAYAGGQPEETPYIYARVQDPNGEWSTSWPVFINEVNGDWSQISYYFPVSIDGNYTLRLYIEPRATISQLSYWWDDITIINIATANTTTDSIYSAISANEGYLAEEIDISILDSGQTSDIGALTFPATANELTSSWTRYGKTVESRSLIDLFVQQYMNDRQVNHDRLTVELYDQDETINHSSILTIGSKTYRWLDRSKNFKTKIVSGTIVEIDNSTDVSYTLTPLSLTSVDGQSNTSNSPGNQTFASPARIYSGEYDNSTSYLTLTRTDASSIAIDLSGITLQNITNNGAVTTNGIEALEFIKTGGLSTQFLKADGSVDSTTYTPTSRTLTINGTAYNLSANRSWSVGTVTSVGLSVPTGFAITGSPVTGSGTLALAFASGYSLPTTASQANWNTAYNDYIVSGALVGSGLVLTQRDGGTLASIDLSGLLLSSLTWPAANRILLSNGTDDFTSDSGFYYSSNTLYAESAIFSGTVTLGSGASALTLQSQITTLPSNTISNPTIYATTGAGGGNNGDLIIAARMNAANRQIRFYSSTNGTTNSTDMLTLNPTTGAFFAGDLSVGDEIKSTAAGSFNFYANSDSTRDFYFKVWNGTSAYVNAFHISNTGGGVSGVSYNFNGTGAAYFAGTIETASHLTSAEWEEAHSWGDHSLAGYLTSETSHADVVVDGDFTSNGLLKRTALGVYAVITDNSTNWDTAYNQSVSNFTWTSGTNTLLLSRQGASNYSLALTTFGAATTFQDDVTVQNELNVDTVRGYTNTGSFINLDYDSGIPNITTNAVVISSVSGMGFVVDNNFNDNNLFAWHSGDDMTNPLMTLDQDGQLTVYSANDAILRLYSRDSSIAYQSFHNSAGTRMGYIGYDATNEMGIMNESADYLKLGTNGAYYVYLSTAGQLAIGAFPTGSTKLYVNGDAKATGNLYTDGQVRASGNVIANYGGTGSVAMTVNDGYGNANLTFNHISGTADVAGPGGRIVVNVDAGSGATPIMTFELGTTTSTTVAYNTPSIMELRSDRVNIVDALRIGDTSAASTELDVVGDAVITQSLTLNGILLEDSSDRSGLLEINRKSALSWSGIQINHNGGLWSVMGQVSSFGLYDDALNDWILYHISNTSTDLRIGNASKLKINTSDTYSYNITKIDAGTSEALGLIATASGNVYLRFWASGEADKGYIGYGSPTYPNLYIIYNQVDDSMSFYTGPPGGATSNQFQWYVNSQLEAILESDGDFHIRKEFYGYSVTVTSDERLKKIYDDPYGIDDFTLQRQGEMFDSMIGIRWDWLENSGSGSGVGAQTLQKFMPWLIKRKQNPFNANREELSVNYDGLFFPVLNEIGLIRKRLTKAEEQLKKIAELEIQVEELQRKLQRNGIS